MAKITYITHSGESFDVEADTGSTVMEAALKNSVPGIDAECGGACACATCHVYVDETWVAKAGSAEAMEEDMLDFAHEIKPSSRLSCQMRITDDLDGLIIRIPETQA